MLLIFPHHSCFAVFSTRYIYFQSFTGKPSKPFYQQNTPVPRKEWPGTEWWLKPGNGPGRHLTIRFSQHSKYLVSLCFEGTAVAVFLPFKGENLGNLSTKKMMGQFYKLGGAFRYMLGVPAQKRSINGVTGLADGSETTGECGKTSLPIKEPEGSRT